MEKINGISFNTMSLADISSFFASFISITEEKDVEKLKIAPQFNNLKAANERYKKARQKTRRSEFTDTIKTLDRTRDRITSVILSISKVYLDSDKKNFCDAAKLLIKMFKQFKGIAKKPLKEQSGLTSKLLGIIRNDYSEETKILGLEEWLVRLEKVNEDISYYINKRVSETAEKNKTNIKEAKRELISRFRVICKLLFVYVWTEGDADYADFIRNINVLIGEYKSVKREK